MKTQCSWADKKYIHLLKVITLLVAGAQMQALPGAHPGQVAGMPAGLAAQQAGLAGLTGAQLAGLSAQQVMIKTILEIKCIVW